MGNLINLIITLYTLFFGLSIVILHSSFFFFFVGFLQKSPKRTICCFGLLNLFRQALFQELDKLSVLLKRGVLRVIFLNLLGRAEQETEF